MSRGTSGGGPAPLFEVCGFANTPEGHTGSGPGGGKRHESIGESGEIWARTDALMEQHPEGRKIAAS